MSLPRVFQAKIRAVQIRCSVNLLLHETGRVLAAAGVVVALAISVERLIAVQVLVPWALWSFGTVAAAIVLALWLSGLPSGMRASLLLDERLHLNERFSTSLALAQSEDPFAVAARAESLRVVENADLRGHFPIALSRNWAYGAGVWGGAVAMFLLLPQQDLLGFLKDRRVHEHKTRAVQQAQAEVKKTAESVKAAVRAVGDPNLMAELKKLDELGQSAEPQEVKREAIKALGDLAEKIKQMQAGSQVNTADVLQQMLKQLRGSPDPFSQQVRMALAKGDFAQAAKMFAQLQSQLDQGSLPQERQKEFAARMQELAKELQKLSEQKRQLEEELAKLGLDKQLAQATPEQLRAAMQKQGLKPETIDQILQKVEAGQRASARCDGLGQTLGGAASTNGGLSGDGLAGVVDDLNSLDALQQQTLLLEASLAEISDSLASLGEGIGKSEPWEIGEGGGYGAEGIGLSTVEDHIITSDPLTANKMAKAPSRADNGPAVASWYFRDGQVKGEAQRTFSEVVQAGRASAAEAISENQIPRRYEDAVKAYFNQLEENGPKP